jgi:hypothetical protein
MRRFLNALLTWRDQRRAARRAKFEAAVTRIALRAIDERRQRYG